MKNKFGKKLVILFVIITKSMITTKSIYAHQYHYKSELLPYFRLDFGKSKFINTSGSPDVLKDKNLRSDINSIASAGIGIGINLGDKLRSDLILTHHLYPILRANHNSDKVKRMPKIDYIFLIFITK